MTEVVLLIAHGSRNPAAAGDHGGLCAEVTDRTWADVRPAFLEIDRPTIPEAIDRAVADGAGRVRLLPYFLHPGSHVLRDLPLMATEATGRHPGVEVVLESHIGAEPDLVDLVAQRVAAVPADPS